MLSVLNAQPLYTQVAIRDVGLDSAEIRRRPCVGYASAGVDASSGRTGAAAIQAAINAIVAQITADFARPVTSGATCAFYTDENTALDGRAGGERRARLLDRTSSSACLHPEPLPLFAAGFVGFAAGGAARR